MDVDMRTEQHYRDRAKECVQLAMTARSTTQRIMLQHIAQTWLRLADEAAGATGYAMLSSQVMHEKS
jgi:homoserine acetyltransferase